MAFVGLLSLGWVQPSLAAHKSSHKSAKAAKPSPSAKSSGGRREVAHGARMARRAALAANQAHAVDRSRDDNPRFYSSIVLVEDALTGKAVISKHADARAPMASITKLMTALLIVESGLDMGEKIVVAQEDVDTLLHSRSRLTVGATLTRDELLHLALMSSENRAAHALARTYPGGREVFVAKMNARARALGMSNTHFADSSGLSPENQTTAIDLSKLVKVAVRHEIIREYSTDTNSDFALRGRDSTFRTTNKLVKNPNWRISLQKTGYTQAAGRCVVMYTHVDDHPFVLVLMDSNGAEQRAADANKIRSVLKRSLVFRMDVRPEG